MDVRLDGKIVLVTGAAQGIGEAVASLTAASGAAGILISDRNRTGGEAVAARLSADGVPTEFVAGDLSDVALPASLVSRCVTRFGRIDALVNAAGLTDRGSFLDADPELWEKLFAVNARAPFFLMQAAIKAMREGARGGAIVNILSINTHCGATDLAVYSATKAALALLTKNAANAHRADRIRINGINVGWTATAGEHAMQAETLGQGADWAERVGATQPFGRLMAPAEIANLAVFLLSDSAGPMTGSLVDQEQWVAGARG